MDFKSGEKTIPIKREPPTQMEAERRWIHIIIACSSGVIPNLV